MSRPNKYLTVERFEKFLCNDWHTLKRDVLWLKLLGAGIFIAVIVELIVRN